MNVMKLLEYLQEIIDTSKKMPLTGKVIVSRKEMLDVINQIINDLPEDLKRAQWVLDERERVMSEARREAEDIKEHSIRKLKKEIEEHDICKEAEARAEETMALAETSAQEIIANAKKEAKEIRLGARDYADGVLCDLNKEIQSKTTEMLANLKGHVENFAEGVQENTSVTLDSIRSNINELRSFK